MARERRDFGTIYRRRLSDGKAVSAGSRSAVRPGFYVRVRVGGKEVRRLAGYSRKEADEYLANLQTAVRSDALSSDDERRKPKEIAFEVFAEQYLAKIEHEHSPTTFEGEANKLRNVIIPHFKGRAVCTIRKEDVKEFLAGRAAHGSRRTKSGAPSKGASIATRNRDASLLSALFREAVELNYAKANPAAGLGRPKEEERPVPFVDLAEQRVLVEKSPESIRPLVILSLDTGLRQSETLNLLWSDVDVERRILLVRRSKSKKSRVVPLSVRLVETLQALRTSRAIPLDRSDDRVFSWIPVQWAGASQRAWRAATAAAKLPDLRWHDLRHIAACNLVRAGVPLPDVAKVLGHGEQRTTWRYASHSPTDSGTRARALLDAYLSGSLTGSLSGSPARVSDADTKSA